MNIAELRCPRCGAAWPQYHEHYAYGKGGKLDKSKLLMECYNCGYRSQSYQANCAGVQYKQVSEQAVGSQASVHVKLQGADIKISCSPDKLTMLMMAICKNLEAMPALNVIGECG